MILILFLFWAFFLSNLLGYGGGPASIPLNYEEIVNHFHWMTNEGFSNMLALANALPGPIATKIAALLATVLPSASGLILLLKLIDRFRQSPVVKGMTLSVQPVIAMMMLLLTWEIGGDAVKAIGWTQSLAIAAISFFLMTKFKLHPAFLIVAAFLYGGFILPHS